MDTDVPAVDQMGDTAGLLGLRPAPDMAPRLWSNSKKVWMLAGAWSEDGQAGPCFRNPARWRIRKLLALTTSLCTICS